MTAELIAFLLTFMALVLLALYCLCRWEDWFSSAEEHTRRRWRAWRQFLRRPRVGRKSIFSNPWSR